MSKKNKVVDRFIKIPSDFTWEELVNVLNYFDYNEVKTGKIGSSRRRFTDNFNNIILLHKPHPSNIIKKYVLRQVLEVLKEKDLIKDE